MPTNQDYAMALSSLSVRPKTTESQRTRTAKQVAEMFFADMSARGTPMLGQTPRQWQKRWLASERFILRRVPVSCVALPCDPKDVNHMLRDIHANTDEPILVDLNKPGVGKRLHGYIPPITVIDGKHRFAAANLRGSADILAWVGELAAAKIDSRGEIKVNTEVRNRRSATPMDTSMILSSQEKNTRDPLHHIIARHTGMDPIVVRNMIAQYKTVHSHKRFGALKSHMEAKAPPGFSECVADMKDHPEIDSPQLLAWHLYDSGARAGHGKKS